MAPLPSSGKQSGQEDGIGMVKAPAHVLERELLELRQRSEKQEDALRNYRRVAEGLVEGGDDGKTVAATAGMNAQMLKVWLRDARSQSEELKALFTQSQQVAREGNALLKRDMEAQASRHKLLIDEMKLEMEAQALRHQAAVGDMQAEAEALGSKCDVLEKQLIEAVERCDIVSREAGDVRSQRDSFVKETVALREKAAQATQSLELDVRRLSAENASLRERIRSQGIRSEAVQAAANSSSQLALKDLQEMLTKSNQLRERERQNYESLMSVKELELEESEKTSGRWKAAEEATRRLLVSLERKVKMHEAKDCARIAAMGETLGAARNVRFAACAIRSWASLLYERQERLKWAGRLVRLRERGVVQAVIQKWGYSTQSLRAGRSERRLFAERLRRIAKDTCAKVAIGRWAGHVQMLITEIEDFGVRHEWRVKLGNKHHLNREGVLLAWRHEMISGARMRSQAHSKGISLRRRLVKVVLKVWWDECNVKGAARREGEVRRMALEWVLVSRYLSGWSGKARGIKQSQKLVKAALRRQMRSFWTMWKYQVAKEVEIRLARSEMMRERDELEEECLGLRHGLQSLSDELKISKTVNRVKEREIELLQWGDGAAATTADTPEKRRARDVEGLKSAGRDLSNLRSDLETSRRLLSVQEENLAKVGQDLNEALTRIDASNREKMMILNELREVQQMKGASDAELERLRQTCESLCEAKETTAKSTVRAQEAWMEERMQLDQEMDLITQEKELLSIEKKAAVDERDALVAERDGLIDERDRLVSDIDIVRSGLNEAEEAAASLRVSLASSEQGCTSIREDCKSLRAEVAALAADKGALQCETASLKQQLDAAKRDAEAMSADLQAVRDEADNKLQLAKSQVTRLQVELTSVKDRCAASGNELEASVRALETTHSRLGKKNCDLQAASDELEVAKARLEEREEHVNEARSALEDMKAALQNKVGEFEEVKRLLEVRDVELRKAQRLLGEASSMAKDLEAQLYNAQREKAAISTERKELLSEIEKIKKSVWAVDAAASPQVVLPSSEEGQAVVDNTLTIHCKEEGAVSKATEDITRLDVGQQLEDITRLDAIEAERVAAREEEKRLEAMLQKQRKEAVLSILMQGSKGMVKQTSPKEHPHAGVKQTSPTGSASSIPDVTPQKAGGSGPRDGVNTMRRMFGQMHSLRSSHSNKQEQGQAAEGRAGARHESHSSSLSRAMPSKIAPSSSKTSMAAISPPKDSNRQMDSLSSPGDYDSCNDSLDQSDSPTETLFSRRKLTACPAANIPPSPFLDAADSLDHPSTSSAIKPWGSFSSSPISRHKPHTASSPYLEPDDSAAPSPSRLIKRAESPRPSHSEPGRAERLDGGSADNLVLGRSTVPPVFASETRGASPLRPDFLQVGPPSEGSSVRKLSTNISTSSNISRTSVSNISTKPPRKKVAIDLSKVIAARDKVPSPRFSSQRIPAAWEGGVAAGLNTLTAASAGMRLSSTIETISTQGHASTASLQDRREKRLSRMAAHGYESESD